MNDSNPSEIESVEKSTLDRHALHGTLTRWIEARLPNGAAPELSEFTSPSGTGMSSETLLFDLTHMEQGERKARSLVARLAPQAQDVPVFPHYDLESQFRLLQLVGEHGEVPVPPALWLETDPAVLGTPFFVMERVEGRVPDDIPPYVFAGWIFDADAAQRDALQASTVAAIAALHAIDPEKSGAQFLEFDVVGESPLERHMQNQRDYYAWVTQDGMRHPVLERAFEWLDAHWPEDEGETVISWGDSRIGNILYRGFEPAALLDWEMAGLGPREMDIGWLCFMHSFFHEIAVGAGLPGLPDFLRLPEVAERYEACSGHRPRNLLWHYAYAGLRHGIVMARIHRRMIHFGHSQPSEDPDAVIPHGPLLGRLLDGSWSPLD